MRNLKLLFKNNSGATAIEYGLIAALIAIGLILSLRTVGTSLNDNYYAPISDTLSTTNAP